MITVISGTNRPNSFTSIVSRQYVELLKEVTEEPVHLIDLAELPHDWFTPVMYQENQQGAIIRKLQDEYIAPASRLVVTAIRHGFARHAVYARTWGVVRHQLG